MDPNIVDPNDCDPDQLIVRVLFRHDYVGRRVDKRVEHRSCASPRGWVLQEHRKFVWAGRLALMELNTNNQAVKKHTWGLDLAGQAGAAQDGAGHSEPRPSAAAESGFFTAGHGGPALQAAGGIGRQLLMQIDPAVLAAQFSAGISAERRPDLIAAIEQLALNPPEGSTTDWSAVLAALEGS